MTTVTVAAKDIAFVKTLFPGYRKRQVRIMATTQVRFYNLNWDGGSRNEYSLISLADGRTASLAAWNQVAPWNNAMEGKLVELVPGYAVVQTGFCVGKPSTMTIYAHPSNVTPLLTNAVNS